MHNFIKTESGNAVYIENNPAWRLVEDDHGKKNVSENVNLEKLEATIQDKLKRTKKEQALVFFEKLKILFQEDIQN